MEGRTTIMIAHRLSTLRAVDEILVLNEGKVDQRGSHDRARRPARPLQETVAGAGRRPGRGAPGRAEAGGEAAGAKPSRAASARPGGGAARPERRLRRGAWLAAGATKRAKAAREGKRGARKLSPRLCQSRRSCCSGCSPRSRSPGPAWLVGHYAAGFERLGYEVYYVEAHARTPTMFMRDEADDGSAKAARFVAGIAERFGLEDRWAFQAMHEDGRCYGMSAERARSPLPRRGADHQHARRHPAAARARGHRSARVPRHRSGRRSSSRSSATTAARSSCSSSTRPSSPGASTSATPTAGCPGRTRFPFVASPPPVVLDFWDGDGDPTRPVHDDRQLAPALPQRALRGSRLRLEQAPAVPEDPRSAAAGRGADRAALWRATRTTIACPGRARLAGPAGGWSSLVTSTPTATTSSARRASCRSPRSRTSTSARGWFSERSATYLAAGRPVILQDTGFGAALPTGEGLFAFADLDGAADAIAAVQARPGPPPSRRTRDRARVSEPRGRARGHARPRRAAGRERAGAPPRTLAGSGRSSRKSCRST